MHGSKGTCLLIGALLSILIACDRSKDATKNQVADKRVYEKNEAHCVGAEEDMDIGDDHVLYEYRCGKFTVQGVGLEPFEDYAPSYFTKALVVRSDVGKSYTMRFSGTLYFSDWGYEPCSPDLKWFAFLQDHYGPIYAVKNENLLAYLNGMTPDRVIFGDYESLHAEVHSELRWREPSTLIFETGGSPPIVHEVVLE